MPNRSVLRVLAVIILGCGSAASSVALAQDYPLLYSTTFSGLALDHGLDSIPLPDGTVVVVGVTESSDFPALPGVVPPTGGGDRNVFVTRLDPSLVGASQLLWTTFIGGNGSDTVADLHVDDLGRIWVGGYTESTDFPVTAGALQVTRSGLGDAFLAQLDLSGTLEWATYFGGSGLESISAIDVIGDAVWIGGVTTSLDLPTVVGAPQPSFAGGLTDHFVSRIDLSLAGVGSLGFSTYLGSSGGDGFFPSSALLESNPFTIDRSSIDIATDGRVAYTGETTSSN